MRSRIYIIALIVFMGQTIYALTWNKPNMPEDTNNVIALWHFEDLQSGLTIADAGTNGYDLTSTSVDAWATGGTWNSASNTGYFACNTNYSATLPLAKFVDVDWTKDLTISFWVRAKSTMGKTEFRAFYLGKNKDWGDRARSTFSYHGKDSDPFRPTMRDQGVNLKVDSFKDDTWHHIGMVYDYHGDGTDNIVKIYYDNELQNTHINIQTTVENLNFWLGRYVDNSNKQIWAGDIDEFFIYSGVITNFSDGYPAKDIPPPPPKPMVKTNRYETAFTTLDVANDWNISGMAIYTNAYTNITGLVNVGRMTVDKAWNIRKHATLNYASATSLSNVTISSRQQCRVGNDNTYTEVAVRTSNGTNGISLRVFGRSTANAKISLYDGTTLIGTSSSSINSQQNLYDVTLSVCSNQVSATVSNSQDVVSLSGIIINSLSAGNIRIAGVPANEDESARPTIYNIKVEEYIDDPTPRGTLIIIK